MCMYEQMYMYVYVYTYAYTHTYAYMYTYMYIHAYEHAYVYVYVYVLAYRVLSCHAISYHINMCADSTTLPSGALTLRDSTTMILN